MSNSIRLIITYILYDHPLLCKNQLHSDEFGKQSLFISTKFEGDQRSQSQSFQGGATSENILFLLNLDDRMGANLNNIEAYVCI